MDAQRYPEFKKKGLATVHKIGAAYAYSCKRFDAQTGEELEPEVGALSISQLEAQVKQLQAQILAIQALITDLQAIK